MKSWVYVMMVVAAGSLVGCGSKSSGSSAGGSSGGDGGGGAGGSTGGGGSGGTTVSTSTSTSTSSTSTTMTGDACADMTDCTACLDGATCQDCCDGANADSLAALITAIVTECACVDGSVCKTACAPVNAGDPDICADPTGQTTQACVDCVNGEIMNQGACVQSSVTACSGDGTCSDILACYQGCPQ